MGWRGLDRVELGKERYMFITLVAAMGQCLLSMKGIGGKNGASTVYGFATIGRAGEC